MKSAKIFMYDRYAGILKKMKPASSANEVSFKCQRSLLHLPSRLYSFCGLTILVDHFKLYLYYELTQLLLIYNSR